MMKKKTKSKKKKKTQKHKIMVKNLEVDRKLILMILVSSDDSLLG